MNNVSLRIVMQSAAVDVLLPRDKATNVFTRWASRDYQLKGEQIIQGQDLYGYSYAVKVDEINALFVMPMPNQAPQPQPALPGNWAAHPVDRSGTFVR